MAKPSPAARLLSGSSSLVRLRNVVVIRHTSKHQIIAALEVISPRMKSSRHHLRCFVERAEQLLRAGIHLLIVDLLPPTARDPQGIHKAIWAEFDDKDLVLPPDKLLSLASYNAKACPKAFIQPIAVGSALPDMPLFLTAETYLSVPLEATYQSAWEAVPTFWREVLS